MTSLRSDFLRVLTERGYVHQCSDLAGLDAAAAAGPITAYVGYDCTGPSLHVGHLLSIMMLHRFQETGHRPITLMGGGTTRVGDPSGKDESRRILTLDQIEANKASLRVAFERFLRFGGAGAPGGAGAEGGGGTPGGAGPEGGGAALMADNAEWLAPLNYIDFLRDVGRHFSVNRMLSFDSVRLRLDREHELSFLEFNYMILQAYDFVELNRRTGCTLQMGGSDQWGNIVNGLDLGRRMGTPQLYALTCPLVTTSSGAKMGKTAAGAVWLNADLTSPYDYWQFWRNTEDADVGRFLRLFTLLPLAETERLGALGGVEINEAKKVLASEATALLHGREAAERAAGTARQTFEQGTLARDLPSVEVPRAVIEAGLGVLTAFGPDHAGLLPSSSEARRQVRSGGLKVNDATVTDERALIRAGDLTPEGVVKLSFGRKKHVLLRAV